MVTSLRSRFRVANKDEGTSKPEGDSPILHSGGIPTREYLEGQEASGSGHRAIGNPAILGEEISHGGDE